MESYYFYVFFFFTIWNIILILFHKYTHRYVELLYLSYMTFMVGMYFSTVNPRQYIIYYGKNNKLVISKWYYLLVVDLFFHFAMFLFVYFKYYKFYKSADTNMMLFGSILVLIIYICLINSEKVYGISFMEILTVITIVTLLYFLIF